MNPLTNVKNVLKLSERELTSGNKTSWHDQYRDSAWIFVGGLPYDLSEGDVICVFSQYGEIVNINLVRDKDTGKSKGFCFLCYEDQRSTVLAVDNFNGIKILNRTIRVDHVAEYKVPKEGKKTDEETKKIYEEGCAPKPVPVNPRPKTPPQDFRETIADQIEADIKLPPRLPIYPIKQEPDDNIKTEKKDSTDSESSSRKKAKKSKKKKKKRDSTSEERESHKKVKEKKKKHKHSSKDANSKDANRHRKYSSESENNSYKKRKAR